MNRKQIGKRLALARERNNLSRADVSSRIEIGTTTLQQWEAGNREASIEALEKIAQLYNVTPQYLIFGDEETPYIEQLSANDEYDYVPAYSDVRASAGHGVFNDDMQPTTYLAFRKDWLNSRSLKVKDLVIIFTDGDSMSPTIPDGATLVIDRSRNYPKDGKIYVIRIDDRLYVKRVQWILNGGLRLISDNKFYEPLDISRSELEQGNIEVIGQIIHTSHDYP